MKKIILFRYEQYLIYKDRLNLFDEYDYYKRCSIRILFYHDIIQLYV